MKTMANRNDFKLLRQRCIRHFELAKDCLNAEEKTLTDDQKARYGFYFFCNSKSNEYRGL